MDISLLPWNSLHGFTEIDKKCQVCWVEGPVLRIGHPAVSSRKFWFGKKISGRNRRSEVQKIEDFWVEESTVCRNPGTRREVKWKKTSKLTSQNVWDFWFEDFEDIEGRIRRF